MKKTYAKDEGKRDLMPALNQPQQIIDSTNRYEKSIAPEYTKKEGTLDPSLFIIVSGGEEREKDYFNFFRGSKYSFPRLQMEFVSANAKGISGLNVDDLVALALEIKAEKDQSKSDDLLDSIFVVTDVDHFYNELRRNIPICKQNSLQLIISNPCFELWLYYAYYSDLPTDFVIPANFLKISSQFKTYLGNKHKGGVDPRKAPLEIAHGIENSRRNYQEDANGIPKLFSTQMHFLAQKLHTLSSKELFEIQSNILRNKQRYHKS